MNALKLKVCGMRNPENIKDLLAIDPDFIGFIFFEKSKRFIDQKPSVDIPKHVKKVGVFVNESVENVRAISEDYDLDFVQLHGDESVAYCTELKDDPVKVIKVFSVGESFDFTILAAYEDVVDYFLFDTKGKERGGNGIRFNWQLLSNYPYSKPFLLSGGIGPETIDEIKLFNHPQLFALDVNSGFEIEPGLKNVELLKIFKHELYS